MDRPSTQGRARGGAAALCALALMACAPASVPATSEGLAPGSRVYTLTNLHPDEERSKLTAVNYQQAGLIPVCTEVEVVSVKRKVMVFRIVESQREYRYFDHKASAEPFQDHLARFFGGKCPKTTHLGKKDQEGIRSGQASVGMTREGVRIAMGHPPRHVNPDPNGSSQWMYWMSRFNRRAVNFDGSGRVSSIQE
jgi:hypothetical protein